MQTIDITSVQHFMTCQVRQVFDTMFSMTAASEPGGSPTQQSAHVSGSVGFAGETVTGAVYLHLPSHFASVLAACMLCSSVDELSEPEVNDVVGEVTNMLTGGLKSWLCDSGADCAVSTPGIIRGSSFSVEPLPEIRRLCLGFSSGPNRFSVEVHFKFQ